MMASRLMSTRARAQLWKLQEAVRLTARERDQLLRHLDSCRLALSPSARRDLWLEYSLAEQEYRHAVAALAHFCEEHGMLAERGMAPEA